MSSAEPETIPGTRGGSSCSSQILLDSGSEIHVGKHYFSAEATLLHHYITLRYTTLLRTSTCMNGTGERQKKAEVKMWGVSAVTF